MSKLNQVIHLELITESGMNPSNLQMWIRTKIHINEIQIIVQIMSRDTMK